MGWTRLKKKRLERLEDTYACRAMYAKRKHMIGKKACELSILCDIDIMLLMFSPTGKPLSLCGKHGIEEVIAKFAQLTPLEREKRKLESLEALRKTFKKLGHDVNIRDYMGPSFQTIEVSLVTDSVAILELIELRHIFTSLRNQLAEKHKRLSCWFSPGEITNLEQLGQMEDSIRYWLKQIETHKENMWKQNIRKQQEQVMPLECKSQFQNEMNLSFRTGVADQVQHMSWVPENEDKHLVKQEDPNSLPYRMGVADQLHHMSWVPKNEDKPLVKQEDPNSLPYRDLKCSASSSFGSYSGYFGSRKTSEMSNVGHENGTMSNLGTTASPVPYNLNMLGNVKLEPVSEMSLHENTFGYRA